MSHINNNNRAKSNRKFMWIYMRLISMQGEIIIAESPQKLIITEGGVNLAMAQSGINLAMTPKAELTDLQKLELKEAFDEFDKVLLQ